MKTKQDLQTAVDELLDVCKKHGVVLIGTCASEGIYGEIAIAENTESAIGWSDPNRFLTNRVEEQGDYFAVDGIGELRSANNQ